jgi:hypothetical protein
MMIGTQMEGWFGVRSLGFGVRDSDFCLLPSVFSDFQNFPHSTKFFVTLVEQLVDRPFMKFSKMGEKRFSQISRS